jgi:hypothetical protein
MNAVSCLTVLPSTKKEIESFTGAVIENILSGNDSALKIDQQLKAIEAICEKIRKHEGIKEAVISEAEKYGKGDQEFNGAKFNLVSRASYDYSLCQMWNELKDQEKAIAEKRKKLETIMQSISAPVADAETGELVEPAVKSVSQIITWKL